MVRRVALLLAAAPAVVVAVLDGTSLTVAAVHEHPWWRDYQLNLSEAAAVRDDAEMVRLIERGDDPNLRRRVRPGLVGNEADVEATPLEAAISIRRPELIGLLFQHGARVGPAEWRRLYCSAVARDYTDVVAVLEQYRQNGVEPRCSGSETLW